MGDDLKWGIGILATIIAGFIAQFRILSARISTVSDKAHGRIDEVKDQYVRRDDHAGHIKRIEDEMRQLRRDTREEQAETRRELREGHQQIMAALASRRDVPDQAP